MSIIDIGYQTCIICKTPHEVIGAISTPNIPTMDLDSRPRGVARNSEKNCVHYCPNCGYASFNLEKDITFGNHDILSSNEYQEIVNNIDLFKDAKKFYLVGLILNQNQDYQRAATSFLRASWFFNDNGNSEWMRKSKLKAIEAYQKSEFTFKNEHVFSILIDLHRRISQFNEAIKLMDDFDLSTIEDETIKKILDFEYQLCKNCDNTIHTTNEI